MRKKYKRSETFAKRVGVSRQAVDAWRNGQKKPTWRNLIKIAEVLKITPRQLIIPSKRFILDKWEDHLIDYLEAPPEVKKQTKTEITVGDGDGSRKQKQSKMDTERELKLTTKDAIDLAEKLGYFEEIESNEADEPDTETYDPLKDLVEND